MGCKGWITCRRIGGIDEGAYTEPIGSNSGGRTMVLEREGIPSGGRRVSFDNWAGCTWRVRFAQGACLCRVVNVDGASHAAV